MAVDEPTLPQSVQSPVRHPLLRRLGLFAAVHFTYSILSFHLSTWLLSAFHDLVWQLPPQSVAFPLVPALMALYIPLGLLAGNHTKAPVCTLGEMLQATALEAGIAWCWAAVVITALCLPEGDALLSTGLLLIFPTFFLAYPSCCFVLFVSLFPMSLFGGLPAPLILGALAVPAGLLPPLLFNLGCLWAGKRKMKEPAE